MRRKKPEIYEVENKKLADILGRATQTLNEEDAYVIKRVFESYEYVADLIQAKNMTIRRLQEMTFGSKTEKTAAVTGHDVESDQESAGTDQVASDAGEIEPEASAQDEAEHKPAPKGHGRNSADAYQGAERVEIPHEHLCAGDACPECQAGTVYEKSPVVLVRITGQAPLHATRYELQKLRCNLCGKVFTAKLPESAGTKKYDAKAASMIGLLKYGAGMPFNRLEGLQRNLNVPLPASTQWDVVHAFAPGLAPVFEQLIREAAQGDVLHNDDTTVKILELMGEQGRENIKESEPSRTGLFTSGVVATRDGHRMALFFSGRRHAGENLTEVLKHRAEELAAPIQMCDALSRNLPRELRTIVANCLAHARRQFVEVHDHFPDECRYVLEELKVVYHNDNLAKLRGLSDEQRLRFHRGYSRQPMKRLHKWLTQQFDKKLVEPNSSLGQAIKYMLKHWDKLTLFLDQAGAPLDNNVCERALKKAQADYPLLLQLFAKPTFD